MYQRGSRKVKSVKTERHKSKKSNLWMELHAVETHLLVVDGGDDVVRGLCAHAEPFTNLLHAVAVC